METKSPQTACSGNAEAVLNLQPNSSISIAYHSQFGPHSDIMLLELDEKLLPDVLHQRVTLRGQSNEEAVLCTQTTTYAVKFVGTSNSVFLIPPSDDSAQESINKDVNKMAIASVLKVSPGFLELVEVAPKLDKLKLLLSEKPYSFGEASEMDIPEQENINKTEFGFYRWDDLVDRLQASDHELRSGLKSISALEINGYWRILDEEYMNSILNMLLHDVILSDWSINALNEDEVMSMLEIEGFPRIVGKHCLIVHGDMVSESERMWKLDERRVCVQLAREILREDKMKIEMFMDKWMKKVPEGMRASFDMLEGEVLIEKLGIENWVYLFSVSSLPSTPAERFSQLFKERARWEWKDLQPYVRDLKVPGLSSEGLLLKYTRRTQPTMDAEPVFSAR